jgi:hypothetical protein
MPGSFRIALRIYNQLHLHKCLCCSLVVSWVLREETLSMKIRRIHYRLRTEISALNSLSVLCSEPLRIEMVRL